MRTIIIPVAIVAGFIAYCVNFVERPRCTSSHVETKDGFYIFAKALHNDPHDVALCDQWEGENTAGSSPRKPQR